MNETKIFNNGNIDLPVREVDGQIEFDAEASAIGLGISFVAKSGNEVVRWSRVRKYLNSPQVSKGDYISEPDFYTLAIKANNPTAEKFQYWVTHEVLPSIREHGAYMTDEKAFEVVHNSNGLADLLQQASEQLRAKDIQIEQMGKRIQQDKPKVIFANAVSVSDTTILVGELAKILKQNGVNIGATRLFAWLRENGYLISRKGTDWNMPTQRSMELGLFEIKETTITHSDGHTTISKTTKVTGKGQQYFINKFLKDIA
ncbi:phage antirepressor Ant [Ligilactobacillus murinus]|uniref:phage antirepressor n=1 Tax=Ligilactobacillus murinus TaxID=1622 RepID=UPI001C8CE5C5|nr:phage antirepressor KilAC domain-containing protein [Ligilactobacillus murinus]MBX9013170.1 phage antirepressor Ant [Ligilactobacillus murinus]